MELSISLFFIYEGLLFTSIQQFIGIILWLLTLVWLIFLSVNLDQENGRVNIYQTFISLKTIEYILISVMLAQLIPILFGLSRQYDFSMRL